MKIRHGKSRLWDACFMGWFLCLGVLMFRPCPVEAIAVSLQIVSPEWDKKVVLSPPSGSAAASQIDLQARVSIPEKPEKESEAVIVWRIDAGDSIITESTASMEKKTVTVAAPFPRSNWAFGNTQISVAVYKLQAQGTGSYYGDGTLKVTVLESNPQNYEGYIINSSDRSEQDIVIGDPTDPLEGCVYYLAGYCTEASKHIPHTGNVFGTPWTSTDTLNWAYWVRQTVLGGNAGGYGDHEILNSVWYITNRSGTYSELLQEVGYPEDGPVRPPDDEPPAPPAGFNGVGGDQEVVLKWTNPGEGDFVGTLIRYRDDGKYPEGPEDGFLLENVLGDPADAEELIHKELTNGVAYYYAAFSYDEVPNYSEAVSASATPQPPAPIPPDNGGGGCGCSTGTNRGIADAPATTVFVLVVVALFFARRMMRGMTRRR